MPNEDSTSRMQALQVSLTGRNAPAVSSPIVGFPRRLGPILGSMGLSLMVHAVLVMLFTVATWAVVREAPEPEYAAEIVQAPPQVGAGRHLSFHDQSALEPGSPDMDRSLPAATADLQSLLEKHAESSPRPLAAPSGGLDTLAVHDLRRGDIVGIGIGSGNASGMGHGQSGRSLTGGGPVGSMWGVGAGQTARSVVYVMDRSGSMTDTFSLLQHELIRAIGTLNREQLFNVIWFNEGKPEELFPRLKEATIDNKREAFMAIKRVVPSGQTEPVEALRRGLSFHPDVMFLLSDGDFGEENGPVVNTIRQRNKSKSTTINTILFVYDNMGDGERILRQIAQENHGIYKHVTEADTRGG